MVTKIAKARANAIVDTLVDAVAQTITFTTIDGKQFAKLELGKMSASNLAYAALHGMKQRCKDGAALQTTDDYVPTAQDKFYGICDLVAHYNSGATEWSVRGDGAAVARVGNTLQAFANVYGFTLENAKTKMEGFAAKRGIEYKEALKIWAGADKIVEEVARMKAAIPAKLNADELLNEMK
jgi:hypothetical protein